MAGATHTGVTSPAEVTGQTKFETDPRAAGGLLIEDGMEFDRLKGETSEEGLRVRWEVWLPEQPVYAGRLLLAGGWTSIPKMYEAFCDEMAKRGMPVINMETPHKKGIGAFSPLNLRGAWESQADAINAVEFETRALAQTDRSIYLAHSGSGEHAVDAAINNDGETDYVMLFGSAGQDGNHFGTVLARRLPWFVLKEGLPVFAQEAVRHPDAAASYLINMAMHPYELAAEGISAGNAEIVNKIREAEDADIPVVNIIPKDDEIFLSDHVISHIDGRVELHHSELKGHLALQSQPAEAAEEIIMLHRDMVGSSENEYAAAA